MTETSLDNGKVLIVDDDMVNTELLADYLQSKGYATVTASNGFEAIEAVESSSPEVVLLDIMMPKMDGFEACMRIKADTASSAVPVLMITALDGTEDRKKAMAAGADDFITKPFDFSVVSLRVRNAIRQYRQFLAVQDAYEKLKELEELRDTLMHCILHDVRSPLSGALAITASLNKHLDTVMDDRQAMMMGRVQYSLRMTLEMLNSILDVAKIETSEFPLSYSKCDVKRLVEDAVALTSTHGQDTVLEAKTPEGDCFAECDESILSRVVVNLIDNALKHAQKNGHVSVALRCEEEEVEVRVIDNGSGIPPEMQGKIFDKFASGISSSNPSMHSPGLGLAFCKLAVEAHDGQIGVESEPERGSEFWLKIPTHRQETSTNAA